VTSTGVPATTVLVTVSVTVCVTEAARGAFGVADPADAGVVSAATADPVPNAQPSASTTQQTNSDASVRGVLTAVLKVLRA
jgi:hypothetical protein